VNPYEILGVVRTATDAEIRRAYLALARRFHPDANPGGEERMRLVNEAWAVLGDRSRRAAYDRAHLYRRDEEPDPGFRPHETTDDGFDPRAQPDVPYRPMPRAARTRRELLTFLPVGLFASAAVVGGAGFFFDTPAMIGGGVVLFSFACIAMVVVLLMTLVDARHDEG
jgi:curved DNA-binding protein CbpA